MKGWQGGLIKVLLEYILFPRVKVRVFFSLKMSLNISDTYSTLEIKTFCYYNKLP